MTIVGLFSVFLFSTMVEGLERRQEQVGAQALAPAESIQRKWKSHLNLDAWGRASWRRSLTLQEPHLHRCLSVESLNQCLCKPWAAGAWGAGMTVGNLRIYAKDKDILEKEIKKLHSWYHMCAELQEVAICVKEREEMRGDIERTHLRFRKGVNGAIHPLINLITKHLLGTCPVSSIGNAILCEMWWSLSLMDKKTGIHEYSH